VNILKSAAKIIQSRLSAAYRSFDMRDVFFVIGLSLLGYGLWLIKPWLMFITIGILLMALSILIGGKERE
jgi:hypothetical protein